MIFIFCLSDEVIVGHDGIRYGSYLEETQFSKTYDRIPEPDMAISMGCDVGCPYIGRAFDDNWGLEDPPERVMKRLSR